MKKEEHSIDPKTGIRPISEWGPECARGFVSDARFGSGRIIKRTNRQTTRRWLQLNAKKGGQSDSTP
jgi:hypothetical protein